MTDIPTKKFSLYDMFTTDRDAEENGKWVEIAQGAEFKIRRFKSRHTTRTREALEKPYAALRRKGVLPPEIAEKILHQTMCTSTIADWRGEAIVSPDGAPLPFSAEAADQLLSALPELRDEIIGQAIQLDTFRKEDDETAKGN